MGICVRPDFRYLTKDKTEFFCEYKSIASINRVKNSKLMRLIAELSPHHNPFAKLSAAEIRAAGVKRK